MFLDPEDAQIEVCGWPWHGLIVDGVLTLPSGRTMSLARAQTLSNGGHTSLWDIGLPDPDYDPADPDESWLGKAIIRGGRYFYGGGNLAWPGTAEQYSRPPVYVGGVVRAARDLSISVRSVPGGDWLVQAEIFIEGVRYQSNAISSADIGLASGEASQLGADFIDHRWDRARWLARAWAPYGVVALMELRLVVAGGDLSLELALLGGVAECWLLEVTDEETVNIPYSERHHSPGISDAPFAGTYKASRSGRILATAFYKLDATVELVHLHVSGDSVFETTDVSVIPHTRKWINSGEIWLQGNSLGSTSKVSFETSYEQVLDNFPVGNNSHRVDKINGDVVDEYSYAGTDYYFYGFSYGDVSAWPSWAALGDSLDVRLGTLGPAWGASLSLYALATSNCIKQPVVSSLWYMNPSGRRVDIIALGSAITPSGIDPGEAFFDSRTMPNPGYGFFMDGSYNPITGQTIRNQYENYYSWV